MNKLKFFLSLIVTIFLTYFLNRQIPTSNSNIPPIGKLLNPFSGFWQNAEKIDGFEKEQTFSGLDLDAPVRVVYDDKLVPHIFAGNMKDAATVQGYIEAQNRLWQMEFSTRATVGRLSEVLGAGPNDIYKNYDIRKRRKGLSFAAKNTLETWKKTPQEYEMVVAYSKGVNAYINSLSPKDYPIEYKLLDFTPEEWSPLKSAIFLKAMAETLSSRETDIEATNALNSLGKEVFDFLYPERNPKESPIIPKSVEWNFENPLNIKTPAQPSLGGLYYEPFEKPAEFIGSNNWAVSGSKTASGTPILCNDPHLNLTLPAIWFEIQIHTPETNVYGVSLPGVPGVTIGFNENIAWGFTNVGHDISDLYEIKWADSHKKTYHLDNEIKEAELVLETIKVRGQNDVIDTVRYTHWGPVAYVSDDNSKPDLALKWLALEGKGNELTSFTGINFAKNFDDYYNGLRRFDTPAQNVVFASREGDIALKVQGKFPIKNNQQGRFVQDGSKKANDWKGFIPYEQTPFVKNPERGFVASANQFSADTTYPYYYNGGFEDYRGRILNRKLEEMSNITPQDMMALQGNNYSIKAEESLPIFLKYLESEQWNKEEKELIAILKQWDYNFDKDEFAPLLFDSMYVEFYRKTWDEIYNLRKKDYPMLFPESWRTIELLETNPENEFFDNRSTPDKETAKEIVILAFKKIAKAAKNWKKDGKYVTWENHRNTRIPHMIQAMTGFSSKFVSAGGHGDVLNAFTRRGRNAFGPSWRMIVELRKDGVKAFGVYPAGQSGNPGSPFYDSMVQTWASGKYYDLLFLKNKDTENERILFRQTFE